MPLRLEAQHWSGPLLCSPPPDGWLAGNFNFMEYHRPLQLIRDRVVDVWIASYPDVPSGDDPDLVSIPLSRMPVFLVVQEGHPLLGLGDRVSLDVVARYPLLPLPEGAFPKFQKVLEHCGLWSKSVKSSWKGRDNLEDLVVGYSTPLALPLYGDKIRTLPLRMPVSVGDALVVAREYADSPQVRDLASLLRARLEALALATEEVEVLYQAADQFTLHPGGL
jgi:DNA-binding transcriptional LysR family regulator